MDGFRAGSTDYVPKPVSPDAIRQKVQASAPTAAPQGRAWAKHPSSGGHVEGGQVGGDQSRARGTAWSARCAFRLAASVLAMSSFKVPPEVVVSGGIGPVQCASLWRSVPFRRKWCRFLPLLLTFRPPSVAWCVYSERSPIRSRRGVAV